jgi:hypothetical protein
MVNDNIKITEQEKQSRDELVYEWVAYYDDGTFLSQYDDDAQLARHFGHIDKDKIYEFEIVPKTPHLYPIKVNLKTGLFYYNGAHMSSIRTTNVNAEVGMDLCGKIVNSTWGNKAKLIYVRHVRREFAPLPIGLGMQVSIEYEIGWEADVDGKHEKYSVIVSPEGVIRLPETSEQMFERDGYFPI